MTTPVDRMAIEWDRNRFIRSLSPDVLERIALDADNPGLVRRAVIEAVGGVPAVPLHMTALYEQYESRDSAKAALTDHEPKATQTHRSQPVASNDNNGWNFIIKGENDEPQNSEGADQ